MKCIECGAEIENGVYTCKKCNASFIEEDVLIMLNTESLRQKRKTKKIIMAALMILFVLTIITSVTINLIGKHILEKRQQLEADYLTKVEDYLSTTEDIEYYRYTSDSIYIILKEEDWSDLSKNQQIDFAIIMQNKLAKVSYELGRKSLGYMSVQIDVVGKELSDDLEDLEYDTLDTKMVLYADKGGKVQTFEN